MIASRTVGKRRGLTSAAVLVCLVVLSIIAGVLVQSSVAFRGRLKSHEKALQAEFLVESGVDRALARLAAQPDYKGETWPIPPEALGLAASKPEDGPAAVVTIQVEKGPDGSRVVRVRADHPTNPARRVRLSREVVVPPSS